MMVLLVQDIGKSRTLPLLENVTNLIPRETHRSITRSYFSSLTILLCDPLHGIIF